MSLSISDSCDSYVANIDMMTSNTELFTVGYVGYYYRKGQYQNEFYNACFKQVFTMVQNILPDLNGALGEDWPDNLITSWGMKMY